MGVGGAVWVGGWGSISVGDAVWGWAGHRV